MSLNSSASTRTCFSKATLPELPERVYQRMQSIFPGEPLPSQLVFQISAANVLSPQTSHPWWFKTDYQLATVEASSLIPCINKNSFVGHYQVETAMPRILGDPEITDSFIQSHRQIHRTPSYEIHYSQTLFAPDICGDRLYFQNAPKNHVEIVIPGRFIDDEELFDLLGSLGLCGIRRLVERLS